jgi:hypothetical protein
LVGTGAGLIVGVNALGPSGAIFLSLGVSDVEPVVGALVVGASFAAGAQALTAAIAATAAAPVARAI